MNKFSDEELIAAARAQARRKDKTRVGFTPEFKEGVSKIIKDFPDPLDYTVQEMANINYAKAYVQVWHNTGHDVHDRRDTSVRDRPVFATMMFVMGYLLGKEGTSLQ